MSINAQLREHVTSVGFSLTLTKNMTRLLTLVAWADSQTKPSSSPSYRPSDIFDTLFRANLTGSHYVNTVQSLKMRGLLTPGHGVQLNRAGELAVELLKESGIYQDQLAHLQLQDAA